MPTLPRSSCLLLLLGCTEVVAVPEQYYPPGWGESDDNPSDTDENGQDSGEEPEEEPPELLEGLPLLARLSLDLRGTRPTLEEIARVEADPDAVEDLVQSFLEDSRWAERVRWSWNDAIHTGGWAGAYTRFGDLPPEMIQAMGREPLEMVSAIAWEDRPFTDLVTADRVRLSNDSAALWDIPGPASMDEDGWGWGSYPDDRPMAGILSTNSLWLRYTADELSTNRARANALARIFLCSDFLDREGVFTFNVDAGALADVETAVRTQGECLACHAGLDPLASVFGGYAWRSEVIERTTYVRWSAFAAEVAIAHQRPAYFGVPVPDLAGVGALVADDPRFARCSVERFYQGLLGHPPEDPALHDQLTEEWAREGMVVRPLIRRIVALDAYREAEERVLTPEQLQATLMDLFDWPAEDPAGELKAGLQALSWSGEHRLLGGGTDDITVLDRNRTPAVGLQVLLAWAARTVVRPAVEADLARPLDERKLIGAADSSEAEVREALARLHTRFLSLPVEPGSPEVDRLFALWSEILAETGEERIAWMTAIEALVRHPAMVLY